MLQAFRNGRLLTDQGFVQDRVLLVRAGRIEALREATADHRADREVDLGGQMLVPGFIDVQVNGGGGVLFNDQPSVAGIEAIGRAHRRFGTTGYLPTLISDDLGVVEHGLRAVRDAIARRLPGVCGIHIEGPFLAAEKRGIHEAGKLRALDAAALDMLGTRHGGVTLVTLAPELTTTENIRALSERGVIVAAGHSNATYAQTQGALASGLRGFTHLFNAMSPLGSREPGMVGAALNSEAWCGLIVDGHHVHPATLQIALRAHGPERCLLVSDAMPSVGTAATQFELQGKTIYRHGDRLADDQGRLAGAHLDMAGAVRNAVRLLGVDPATAVRMASLHPARFLRLDHDLGRLAPGQRANFALLDDDFTVTATWIDGEAERV